MARDVMTVRLHLAQIRVLEVVEVSFPPRIVEGWLGGVG